MLVARPTLARATSTGGDCAKFIELHRLRLVQYALLLHGSLEDAEDAVQDALERVVARWDGIDEPLRVARRHIAAHAPRRARSVPNLESDGDAALAGVAVAEPDRTPSLELWTDLLRLRRSQRIALVLRYFENSSDEEIAAVLECTTSTVRSHIHRGLQHLRERQRRANGGGR